MKLHIYNIITGGKQNLYHPLHEKLKVSLARSKKKRHILKISHFLSTGVINVPQDNRQRMNNKNSLCSPKYIMIHQGFHFVFHVYPVTDKSNISQLPCIQHIPPWTQNQYHMLVGPTKFRYQNPKMKPNLGRGGWEKKNLVIPFSTRGDLTFRSEDIMTKFSQHL